MYCEKISFKDYRNIEKAEISLTPDINVLYGENAQGKTNLLEGIYYFAGDINGNGAINTNDFMMIKRHIYKQSFISQQR